SAARPTKPSSDRAARIPSMRSFLLRFSIFAALALFSAGAGAESAGKGALDEGVYRVEAELVLDADEVRPGETFHAGVRFKMDEGWHIYWRHPGESGLETELNFEGAAFQPLRWPFPQTFRTGGGFIWTYGYEKEVLLFAAARAPDASGGHWIEARADVLVCRVDCIPADFTLRRRLVVGEARRPSAEASLFDAAATAVPAVEEALRFKVFARAEGEEIRGRLRIEPEGWKAEGEDAFVPDVSPGFE